MKTIVNNSKEAVNVLLVGNNPIELTSILDKLNQIRSKKVYTEIAFDLKTILHRLLIFKPSYILIDDNIGRRDLTIMVQQLLSNRLTKDIPIAVLKNSNYSESLASVNIMDYLLKQNLSSDSLYKMLISALRFKKTQQFLAQVYQKRKGFLMRLTH